MARGGKRSWLAGLLAAAMAGCAANAPPAPRTWDPPPLPPPSGPAAPPPSATPDGESATPLEVPEESADRIALSTLLFAREDRPTLLEERLLISGIDPRDVRDFLQAYNRRSELVQFTPEGVAFAPHALEHMLSLPPTQLLQFRFSGQTGKLVFRLVFP
jgi:hypothetical protein